MKPRFGGILKSHFSFVGNYLGGWIGASVTEVADDSAGEQVGDPLATVLAGEMDIPIAHRGHRGSLLPCFGPWKGWPRSTMGGC